MAHLSRNDPAAHRGPSSDRRAALGWFALTVAAAAAVPLGLLVAGYTLVTRDTARMVEPLRPLVVDALRNGRLPLWNPHEALGIPLLAQIQHGVLHPVSLLGALIVPSAGMDLFVVTYVILAAGGAFVLARQFGASAAGGSVAGLGFGLSGYVLSMSSNLPFLAGAATAPWALAALRAVGHSRGSGRIAGAALGFAALLFAGDPQWAAVSALLGLAFAGEAGGIRGVGRAAGALAVGAMLSAVQLLPTWDYVQLTSRSTVGLSDAERAQWALAPWRLVELVAPGFFGGRPGTGGSQVFLKLGGPTTYGAPFVPSVFVGAPLLALAFLGARSSRGARLLAVAAAVFLWLAMGVHLGSDQLLRHVPVWGSFRYAEKLTGPLVLCLAVLAGLGVSRLPAISVRRWKWATLAAACLAGGVLVFLVTGGDGALESWLGEAAPVGRVRLAVGLAHLCLALAALAAAGYLLGKRTLGSRAGALAVLLVALPSVAAAPFALHTGQRGVREGDPLRAARAEGDVTRVATPARRGPAFGPDSLDDADRSVFLESRMAVMPYGAPAGIDHMGPYSPLWPARYEQVFFDLLRDFGPLRWLAWRHFSVNRLVVDTRLRPEVRDETLAGLEGATKLLADQGLGFSVWEVPHRPWAGFAGEVVPASSQADAYRRLVEVIASGRPAVVVEASPPLPVAPGRVLSILRGAERVRVEAESIGNGVLVVNDSWAKGWKATIDGVPTPVLQADVLVRAVAWPAGRHVLEMTYEPREVRVGWWLGIAGAIVLAALVVLGVREARSTPPRMDQERAGTGQEPAADQRDSGTAR